MNADDAAFTAFDVQMMQRALALAQQGAYTCKPNPMVGCVLVKDGHVVGEGFHQYAGQAHAEIHALASAGAAAQGAVAYVSLEPCAHTGRTGPCADALIAAGVARVVAAMRDPFAQVDGAGFAKLQAAGVQVQSGLLQAQAAQLNRGFLARVQRGRPWLRLKLASSLDGRIALANGQSKWITGEAARADVQHWRARSGALLTSAATVMADNPRLTVRLPADVHVVAPLRVVLDAHLQSVSCEAVREGDAPTLYYHSANADWALGDAAAHQAIGMHQGHIDLHAVLADLAQRGINEVQVEAGGKLAGALLRQQLVDEVLLYIAPVLLGDTARPVFAGLDIATMQQKYDLTMIQMQPIGTDIRLLLQPAKADN